MAGEEDVELRDLVAQSLEAKGVLGKIRAQLRANVFLALEEQELQEKPHPFVSDKLRNFQKTKEGRQAVALVREFLEFFELDFTTAVFDPETNACESYPGRDQLAKDLGVDHESTTDSPLLSSLLRRPAYPHMTHLSTSHPSHFHSSLHSHHLPSHMATFPTSLIPHHHHTSHPHITVASDRSHTITNGNSLPPLTHSELSSLSRPAEPVAMAINSVSVTTSGITTATSSLTMTTGNTLQSTAITGKDSLTSVTSQPSTDKLSWSVGLPNISGGSGLEALDELPATVSTRQQDTSVKTIPSQPKVSPAQPTITDESDNSVSEVLEDDSMGSWKTTDMTHTESSLQGDFDFKTDINPQEH